MRINKITVVPPVIQQSKQNNIQNTMPPTVPQSIIFKGIFVPNIKEQPKYLYNKTLDIMKQCKIGGTIKNEGIDLPTATQKVIEKLKKLGIIFIDK